VDVKLLMTWDIQPGREQDYFEFVVRDFVPGMQKLGMQPTDAWYTWYGDQPQIMAAVVMPSLDAMEKVLNSEDWDELTAKLLDYVEEFEYKIVPARGGFQI